MLRKTHRHSAFFMKYLLVVFQRDGHSSISEKLLVFKAVQLFNFQHAFRLSYRWLVLKWVLCNRHSSDSWLSGRNTVLLQKQISQIGFSTVSVPVMEPCTCCHFWLCWFFLLVLRINAKGLKEKEQSTYLFFSCTTIVSKPAFLQTSRFSSVSYPHTITALWFITF